MASNRLPGTLFGFLLAFPNLAPPLAEQHGSVPTKQRGRDSAGVSVPHSLCCVASWTVVCTPAHTRTHTLPCRSPWETPGATPHTAFPPTTTSSRARPPAPASPGGLPKASTYPVGPPVTWKAAASHPRGSAALWGLHSPETGVSVCECRSLEREPRTVTTGSPRAPRPPSGEGRSVLSRTGPRGGGLQGAQSRSLHRRGPQGPSCAVELCSP